MNKLRILFYRYFVRPDRLIIDRIKAISHYGYFHAQYQLMGNTYYVYISALYPDSVEQDLAYILIDFMDIYNPKEIYLCFLDKNSLTTLDKPITIK